MKVFEYDHGLMKYAALLSRLTILNLLWLALCIPVITAGASTAALYHSASRLMNGDIHTLQNFKEGLKLYWKKGTIVWIFTAILTAAFLFAYYLLRTAKIPDNLTLTVIAGIAFLTLLLIILWIFPVMINFSGKLSELIFNAFVFAFMYAPVTLIAAAFYGIGGFLFIRFLSARLLIILFGHALIVYCTLVLFEKVFQKYKNKSE